MKDVMNALFGNAAVPIKCPKCGRESKQKIRRLKSDPDITCRACGAVFHINAKQFRKAIREANKMLDDLGKSLGKFGKAR